MKKSVATILAVFGLLLGVAPLGRAQVAEILGLYFLNKKLSEADKKELSAGILQFNVYPNPESVGRMDPILWNTATGTVAGWGNVTLEPVPLINGKDPREVVYTVYSSKGPQKFAYVPVKGGRRGPGTSAVDNAGFGDKGVVFDLSRYPSGWMGIRADWHGGSAMVWFAHQDTLKAHSRFGIPEYQAMIAGAGHTTFPSAAIVVAEVDGEMMTFPGEEDLNRFLVAKQAQLNKTEGSGQQEQREEKQTVQEKTAKADKPKVTASTLEIRTCTYEINDTRANTKSQEATIRQQLIKGCVESDLLPTAVRELNIPAGRGRAILIVGESDFSAELVGSGGETTLKYPVTKTENDGRTFYSCIVLLLPEPGRPLDKRLLLRSGSERRVITFTGGER